MITNKELNEVTLSPTKKDYYQIWNELIELADKLSERWSPASTNESDPGIILLKVLTAVADKLNYNIDKNTLEAFMPSATQEDSMRKLTEMMGYDMKHYFSATGKATITYKSSNDTELDAFGEGIYFPRFINLKNEDEDINYITLEEFTLQNGQESREVAIIEGELIECETNTDNIITTLHLDDLNRYILPEYAIAENGIFITNIKDSKESSLWRKEQNLNIQQPGSKVYKVGFDSAQQLPYVQFPEDIKTLMEDGIRIKYVRTNGLNGNISAKVLSKLEKPALWSTADIDAIKNLSADSFTVSNASAANNGADPESLEKAYNNYKKTIGTFDTLVTCRDYMNKIYQMTESDTNTTPLVSNIIVADIRDDINRSTPVCTFNEYGICYKDVSLTDPITITTSNGTYDSTKNKIEHFDLIFYPFKTVYGLNNKTEYKNSFKYTSENMEKIRAGLNSNKTIAHNIIQAPEKGTDDIACIKNYLKLKAKITTTKKVTLIEEAEILNNVYKAIYANFNARQIDFGEEIPYETLLTTLKNADYRIKEVNLDEPVLSTKFSLTDRSEEDLKDVGHTELRGNKLYNSLARRNVLAGKISAFEYDKDFFSEYDKTTYKTYKSVYSRADDDPSKKIKKIESHFDVGEAFDALDKNEKLKGYTLKENEVIQFRVPNFKTTKTYPAYVNYFISLKQSTGDGAIPATFKPLGVFMDEDASRWNNVANQEGIKDAMERLTDITTAEKFKNALDTNIVLFKQNGGTGPFEKVTSYDSTTTYFCLPIRDAIFNAFNTWIKNIPSKKAGDFLNGIYRTVGVQEKPYGRLIDEALFKYLPAYKFGSVESNKEVLKNFYVQETHEVDSEEVKAKKVTADGLGLDSTYQGIPKNGDYQLKSNEYLLINYTDSTKDDSGTERKSVINKAYAEGTIIRANFELLDSALYHTNHSYSKKDGFSFEGQQPEGMFTLGTNEQIEIRDFVKVDLKDDNNNSLYLYWTLNSDDPNKLSNTFEFTESYDGIENTAYTLKEGEHFYYTNSKKQDLVYYGAGTIIVKKAATPELIKYTSEGEISEEEIMTNGLAAAIPWQKYTLTTTTGLTIIENQYISLTEGDTIITIDSNPPQKAETMSEGSWNNWSTIDSPLNTTYRLAENETADPLPAIDVSGIKWSIRSRLDFNMSKTIAQPLYRGATVTLTFENNTTQELKPLGASYAPVYLNSNYICQAATDALDFTSLIAAGEEFKVKVSSKQTPTISNNENLSLNNYINGDAKYTKFDFANLPTDHSGKAFSLNINIPNDTPKNDKTFGLVAIYYIKDATETTEDAYIMSKSNDVYFDGLTLFNTDDIESGSDSKPKSLKPGLNILKLKNNVTQLDIYADDAKKSSIVFGNLDVVTNINPKLDYRVTDSGGATPFTPLDQLLKDIRDSGVATDFYYNVPIQHSNEIDLNPAVEDDLLSSPLSWYDPNNVNRRFVISEVDADYLATGITLTKASRV